MDDQRRTHCYDDFIFTFLECLYAEKRLQEIVQERKASNALTRRRPRGAAAAATAKTKKRK